MSKYIFVRIRWIHFVLYILDHSLEKRAGVNGGLYSVCIPNKGRRPHAYEHNAVSSPSVRPDLGKLLHLKSSNGYRLQRRLDLAFCAGSGPKYPPATLSTPPPPHRRTGLLIVYCHSVQRSSSEMPCACFRDDNNVKCSVFCAGQLTIIV